MVQANDADGESEPDSLVCDRIVICHGPPWCRESEFADARSRGQACPWCRTIIVLSCGRIICQGPPAVA
jgi:hypothetical protein